MAKIIAVNAGSSSLKFQLLEMPEESLIASGVVERIGMEDSVFKISYNGEKHSQTCDISGHDVAVSMLMENLISMNIVKSLDEIKGCGHRVVHGGDLFDKSVICTEEVEQQIEDLVDLAPLHNHAHLVGIRAFKQKLKGAVQVTVFDTAFHQTMNQETYMYALPYEWYSEKKVRKYGMHGTSHKYVSQQAAKFLGKDINDFKIIICHIGNGASLSAVKNGKCVDTSMGFTPLAGIPMGTRCGDIDPAILNYISEQYNMSLEEINDALNKKSGYLGISGVSSDSRDLSKCVAEGNKRCRLAYDIQTKRIADFIGSYYITMGGCDAIAFTAGIGENDGNFRKYVTDRLGVLGVEIDLEQNKKRGEDILISTKNSKIDVAVIPTNEEVMIARDTFDFL